MGQVVHERRHQVQAYEQTRAERMIERPRFLIDRPEGLPGAEICRPGVGDDSLKRIHSVHFRRRLVLYFESRRRTRHVAEQQHVGKVVTVQDDLKAGFCEPEVCPIDLLTRNPRSRVVVTSFRHQKDIVVHRVSLVRDSGQTPPRSDMLCVGAALQKLLFVRQPDFNQKPRDRILPR